MTKFHELSMKSITGETIDFARYQGQVCLVVNLASR
jgi:glutathione peroxidase-family protein